MDKHYWIDLGLLLFLMICQWHNIVLSERINILKRRVDIHYDDIRKLDKKINPEWPIDKL